MKRQYSCTKCQIKFSTSSAMYAHISKSHSAELLFTCSYCKKAFTREAFLFNHKRIRHGIEPQFSCHHCSQTFNNKTDLRAHERIHKDDVLKENAGVDCEKGFARKSALQGQHSCNQCHKKFISSTALDIHFRVHSGERPFVCNYCHKTFTRESTLHNHKRIHHSTEPQFVCNLCMQTFNKKTELRAHECTHNRELLQGNDTVHCDEKIAVESDLQSQHSCTYCQKKFSLQYLKTHVRIHIGERPFACNYCNKTFTLGSTLFNHKKIHHMVEMSNEYACSCCEQIFDKKSDLRVHEQVHGAQMVRDNASRNSDKSQYICKSASQMKHSCTFCNEKFSSSLDLNIHCRIHIGERLYSCKYCAKTFICESSLYYHERFFHSTEQYPCNYCEEAFGKKSDFLAHQRLQHLPELIRKIQDRRFMRKMAMQRNISCTLCDKMFFKLSELKIHFRTHTGERPFACKYCSMTFTARGLLTRHERRCHTGERPFACSYCPKTFTAKYNLSIHENTHTGRRPYRCKECGKAYAAPSMLFAHRAMHSSEMSCQCSKCAKMFRSNIQLRKHERKCRSTKHRTLTAETTHGTEAANKSKTHMCTVCGKSVFCMSKLLRHMRVHTGERPYRCELCYLSFKQKRTLQKHELLRHDGIAAHGTKAANTAKTHSCTVCGKSISCWSKLLRHMRVHTSERPYRCELCDVSFKEKRTLQKHERLRHDGLSRLKCAQCMQCFTDKDALERHVLSHADEHRIEDFVKECSKQGPADEYSRQGPVYQHSRQEPADQCNKDRGASQHSKQEPADQHSVQQSEEEYLSDAAMDFNEPSSPEDVRLDEPSIPKPSAPKVETEESEALVQSSKRPPRNSTPFQNTTPLQNAAPLINTTSLHNAAAPLKSPKKVGAPLLNGTLHDSTLLRDDVAQALGPLTLEPSQCSTADEDTTARLRYNCRYCLKLFADCDRVSDHILTTHIHVESQFGCGACGRSFEFAPDAVACMSQHEHTFVRYFYWLHGRTLAPSCRRFQ